MDGRKVKNPPEALLEYELCKTFHCLPSELYNEDSQKIEEFIVIMNAINEHEKKGSRKGKRDELKRKFGASRR